MRGVVALTQHANVHDNFFACGLDRETSIGANIRYYRCLHHLTQEKLAELADINEKSISAYENDTRIPPIFNLLEIAQALGVTMEQLCGVAGPKTIEDELLDRIRMEVKLVLTEYKIDKIDKILK